jgi:DNA polymerase-3 subunit delta
MIITEESFYRALQKGELSPVYLFEGEAFFADEAWKALVEAVQRSLGNKRVVCKRLSSREIPEAELAEFLITPALGAAKKVVWVGEIKGGSRELGKILLRAIEKPNPRMHLVIYMEGEQKILKEIVEAAKKSNIPHVKFSPPKAYHLPRWIQNRVRQRYGKNISPDGARYIAELVGTDFYALDHELEKLAIALPDQKHITIEDVGNLVAGSRVSSSFDVMDALAGQGPASALLKLMELLQSGEQPIAFLGLLARHVRLLWQIKSLEESGKDYPEIKKLLGLPDFVLSKLKEQSHAFSTKQLRALHRRLYEADIQLKSTSLPPIHVLSSILLSFK